LSSHDYDFFVLGAGSGGVRAARIAGQYGARVAVAEERYLGGTCVNVGCIPKKLLVYAAHFHEEFRNAAGFGWSLGERAVDWNQLISNKDKEIERLNGVYDRLLRNANVEILRGSARLVDPNTVEVDGKTFSARYILVATGSWPVRPEIPGIELGITSNEAFYLETLPKRVIIVGGGYIGVEFAGIFHGLGAQVDLLYRGEQILRGFDEDVRRTLADELTKRGIVIRVNTDVTRIDMVSGGLAATLDDGSVLQADQVLYATGRRPKTSGIGLEACGVALDEGGAVVVDSWSRSTVPSIYAVGDCTNRLNLTPMAIAEGQAVAETLFNDNPTIADHTNVPTAVFSQPNIGTVGLTEAEARAQLGAVDVYISEFRPLKHTLTGSDEKTMMKLLVDPASDRVLGCHMVGPEAGEIIQGFAVALKCGATKKQFDSTVGIHPTAAEEFVTMRQKRRS
jgi:glutathione reductase (NADPH)